VLIVTNMYPSPAHPSDGVFVARQVEALESIPGVETEVVYLDTIRRTSAYMTGRSAVRRATRQFAPDVIHIHYGLTQLAIPRSSVPSVVTFHGSDLAIAWQRRVSLALLASRCAAVVVSEEMRRALPSDVPTVVVSSSVDVQAIRTALAEKTRRPLADGGVTRIAFGSSPSRPEKDFALFSATVERLRVHHGIAVEVVVVEGVAPERVPSILCDVDVLLLTSLREGSPTITKEALCCGTRVVSTDVGDMREQCAALSGCRVAETRSADELAQLVLAAISEEPPVPELSLERYDPLRAARRLLELYRSVAGDHR